MEQLKETLRAALAAAFAKAAAAQGWPDVAMPEVTWEYPPEHSFGDLSTTVSFALAKLVRRKPRDIALAIQQAFTADPALVEKVEIAGGGYLNFFVAKPWWQAVIRQVQSAGAAYGRAEVGQGRPRAGLGPEVEAQMPRPALHDRETAAVDGDAGARGRVREHHAGAHDEARAREAQDFANFFHEAREHQTPAAWPS